MLSIRMGRVLVFIICMLMGGFAIAQSYTISGYVTETGSGERLVQANVFEKGSLKGTTTNAFGYYSFRLPTGQYNLSYSYVGYNSLLLPVMLKGDTVINIELTGMQELDEIRVTATDPEAERYRLLISQLNVPVEKIKSLPAFLGEADVYKTLKLLPGVQSGNEGQSGLYIRGGGPDQNLILLDGIPVYNAEHLFGIFSVFNPDMIKNIELYKGGFPARYGGRLSSVVDITSKDGNLHEWKGSFTVGMIASKINLEGPIIKGKTSVNFSARRSYIDLFSKPVAKKLFDENNFAEYYFYDVNLKVSHIFSDRSRLFFSSYYGYDDVSTSIYDSYLQSSNRWRERNVFGLEWDNLVTSLRWNYVISQRLFANFTLFSTSYNFAANHRYTKESEEAGYFDDFEIFYGSRIADKGIRFDLEHFIVPGFTMRYGYHFTDQGFQYAFSDQKQTYNRSNLRSFIGGQFDMGKPWLHEFYGEGDLKLADRLHINAGLHASFYMTDEKNFSSLQPRTSVIYQISDRISVNGAYTKMTQYINLLSSSTFSMPSDLWLPSTAKIPPPQSNQFSIGGRMDLGNGISMNVDAFRKDMKGLIEYKEGVNFFENKKDWEDKVETGLGYSEGFEWLLRRDKGKTTGWIGYTLSWTRRKFDNLNDGRYFYAKYDRRHDISVTLTHQLKPNIDAGLTWVFGSGSAATLPTQQIRLEGLPTGIGQTHVLGYYSERNNYRLPNYHRLDVGVNFTKQREKSTRIWRVGFINAYNQHNPFYLYVGWEVNRPVIKQVSIFPVLPSVSYTVNF